MSNPGTKSGPVERDSPNVYTGTSGAPVLIATATKPYTPERYSRRVHLSGPHHRARRRGR